MKKCTQAGRQASFLKTFLMTMITRARGSRKLHQVRSIDRPGSRINLDKKKPENRHLVMGRGHGQQPGRVWSGPAGVCCSGREDPWRTCSGPEVGA